MKRALLAALAIVCLAVTSLAMPQSAGAGGSPQPTAPFNKSFASIPISVGGDYVPITGDEACTSASWVLWYAAGPAPDYLWHITNFSPLTYTSIPMPVGGAYRPASGDFDDNGCDDVLWHAPGTAKDYIWWGEGNGNFTSAPLTVNGTYEPLVMAAEFLTPDRVFWYNPGPGQEYFWSGQTNRTFASDIGPRVNGTFRATASREFDDSILFHQPGPAPDYIWTGVKPDRTVPNTSTKVAINGDYVPFASFPGLWILYAPGPASDHMILDFSPTTGSLQTVAGGISGVYETGVRSPNAAYLTIWHAPGAAPDYMWLPQE
jgi:hypothetical protein